MTITGRVLKAPQVVYANKAKAIINIGFSTLQNKKFVDAKSLPKWSYLKPQAYPTNRDFRKYDLEPFTRNLKNCGLGVGSPSPPDGFTADFSDEQSLGTAFRNIIAQGVRFVWVILPSDDEATHARIKRL